MEVLGHRKDDGHLSEPFRSLYFKKSSNNFSVAFVSSDLSHILH